MCRTNLSLRKKYEKVCQNSKISRQNTVLLKRATRFLCLIANDRETYDSDWSWKETPGAQRPLKDLRGSHYAVEGIK